MIPFLCPWKQISMETNFFALGISCFYAKAIKLSEAILMLVLLILQTRRNRRSGAMALQNFARLDLLKILTNNDEILKLKQIFMLGIYITQLSKH